MPAILRWLERPHLPDSRIVSGAEFALGAAIVIGHNVFRVLPNEVPILFVLGVASLRIRSGGWAALGFRRPDSWLRLIVIVVIAETVHLLLENLAVLPLAERIWPPPREPAGSSGVAGNALLALEWLAIVWTFAAFGEEISYRGYLLTRAAEAGGRSTLAYWIAIIAVSILFGYGHYYKGPAGIVDSCVSGLILGIVYMLARRNLWACVLAHGLRDTIAVAAAYFSLAS